MWNLKKKWQRSSFQNRKRDTDVENKNYEYQGRRRGMNREIGIDIYTLLYMK